MDILKKFYYYLPAEWLKRNEKRNYFFETAEKAAALIKLVDSHFDWSIFVQHIDLVSLEQKGIETKKEELIEMLHQVKPISISNALRIFNIDTRAFALSFFEDIFDAFTKDPEIQHQLVDRQVVKKRYFEREYEDVYELYSFQWNERTMQGVRVICPSTGRRFFHFIPLKNGQPSSIDTQELYTDAVESVAQMFHTRVPEEYIEKIYRQGDLLIVVSPLLDEKQHKPHRLDKETYITKTVFES